MQCYKCGHDNRSGAKFCEECAAPLNRTCSNCGSQLSATAKFCPECAHPVPTAKPSLPRPASPETYTPRHLAERILNSKTALEGERKQVTVLFADLKGSMELLAERDPEEARKILDPILGYMIEAVHRYEGTVNQVMGDGIMALFGAPIAHEDHAVRACYAALRMQESVKRYAEEVHRMEGAVIQIRIGLNSGEVVVRSIGSDLRMDYTAVGQTTHLGARMEQLAMPGSILITPDTLGLVEGYVAVKSLGPRPIKGLTDPLNVYSVIGGAAVRSRFQAATSRGLTRFVGRQGELEQLRQALEQAHSARGQVVAVLGEPGIGKSRLFWEFTRSHRTQGWLTIEGGSVSYGKATSYLPAVELLRAYFQIEAGDSARRITEKVTGKLLSLDRTLEAVLAPLLWLLDAPLEDQAWVRLDAAQRRHQTLEGIKRLLLRESQAQPLIVVFEDLHWIDPETQALLDSLVESLPGARLLLLVNYRPEYEHAWGSKTYYRQLRIDPLPQVSAEELLKALLGDNTSLRGLKDILIARTEGNPFFIEESVRTLVETRLLAGERGAYRLIKMPDRGLQIPATARALLAARIDRLSPEDKRLLQAASVIGTDVPLDLLEPIVDEGVAEVCGGLTRLQTAEFLYQTRLFPEPEYTFKHALTHEVAYEGLLHDRRRVLHARIVEAIERRHPDRLDEQAERLAHHALKGELKEKAVHYLRQAGLKATQRSALPEAIGWFEQARRVLGSLSKSRSTLEQEFAICFELRTPHLQLGEVRQTLECLRKAAKVAEEMNDARRSSRVDAYMTNIHSLLGQPNEAQALGGRALAVARTLQDLEICSLATSFLSQAHYLQGEHERVVELATVNLAALPVDRAFEHAGTGTPITVFDRCWLVSSLAELGRFAEAAEHEAEAIRIAEPTRNVLTIGLAHQGASILHLLKGEWAEARSLVDRWISVIRTGTILLQLPCAVSSSAWVLAELGEAGEAHRRLAEGEQVLIASSELGGAIIHHGWSYQSLGRACLALGRLDDARRFGEKAFEFSPKSSGLTARVMHLLGDIAIHSDRFDADRGEAHYRNALGLAEPRGMRPLVGHCHLGLGKLLRRTGNCKHAQEHLSIAMTMFREMDMTYWLEQVEAELRQLG